MATRTGKVIIAKNIKLDKEYKNVLNYTESQMLTLVQTNQVASGENFSFLKPGENIIDSGFSYSDALKCNYIAFQNPAYNNKWFFAFLDEVEYMSNGNARLHYTIDEFSTWFDYWNPQACLVLREHVTDDSIGANTYPEGLETGDYIANWYDELGGFNVENSKVIIGVTWLPSNAPGKPNTQYYGGNFSGVYYVALDYVNAKKFVLAYDGLGRGSAIVTMFMAPDGLCPGNDYNADISSKETNNTGVVSDVVYNIDFRIIPSNLGGVMLLSDYSLPINTTLNGYTPKNNKLYCYPYNYILLTNNSGGNAEYHYEDFINNAPIFNIIGTLSPGCSIKMYPENYKKIPDSAYNHPGFNDGLMAGKFPICSWQNDSFVNWMTQQSVNTGFNIIKSGVNLISSILGGNNVGEGFFTQQANYLSERYQHALVGPQSSGSTNGGDVTFGRNELNFGIYKMSIKYEYASMIDDYFEKYGYQVNKIKIPNQIGRPYWNFVQISPDSNIGYSTNINQSTPPKSMDIINNIYRKGVTIWHSHDNLGYYNLNNH